MVETNSTPEPPSNAEPPSAEASTNPDPASISEPSPTPEPPSIPEPPSKEELRLAMKAFRKRLKLTRLDDESRMGYGPTSSGKQSVVAAITPPNQFSKAVWKELAKQGKLKHYSGGLYSLVES